MATLRPKPFLWVTWLTGLLAGEQQCEWAPWFKAHYQNYDKRLDNSNLHVWKAEHGQMVRERITQLEMKGWTVYVENENKFTLAGRAAILAGTPDIVAVKDLDALVIDCKTGQQKARDTWQVLLYMLALPRTHNACSERRLRGELQYKSASVQIAPEQLTDDVKRMIRNTIECVAAADPLPRIPSVQDCKFCDIGSDCPDRIEKDNGETQTEIF